MTFIEDGQRVTYPFTSEGDFRAFLASHRVRLVRPNGEQRGVLTLEQALACKEGSGDVLRLLSTVSSSIEALGAKAAAVQGYIDSCATALEVATTRAIARCAALTKRYGELTAMRGGASFVFWRVGENDAYVEIDGIASNTVSLLVNEAKTSATRDDVAIALERKRKLEIILSSTADFTCKPDIMRELEGMRGFAVVAVLSACNFPTHVVAECASRGVVAMCTNGADYSALVVPSVAG